MRVLAGLLVRVSFSVGVLAATASAQQGPVSGTVFVDANGNGVFDSGDRIVAYVQSWAERSGATKPQREWGDAEVVYATRLAGGGLRYPTAPSWRGATGLVPLASYPWTQRWERSFSYFGVPDPNDSLTADRFLWTFTLQYYNRPDSIRFEANQLDTTRQILFRSQYQGTNDGFHFVWAQVKNAAGQFTSVVDSVNWIGRHPLLVTTPITGSSRVRSTTG